MTDVRIVRRLAGVRQYELATKARIAPAGLSRIESGVVPGSADQRKRIMDVLLPMLRVRQREIGEVFLAAGK
jgi:transcriptional regulator with XRE-family HTH domain